MLLFCLVTFHSWLQQTPSDNCPKDKSIFIREKNTIVYASSINLLWCKSRKERGKKKKSNLHQAGRNGVSLDERIRARQTRHLYDLKVGQTTHLSVWVCLFCLSLSLFFFPPLSLSVFFLPSELTSLMIILPCLTPPSAFSLRPFPSPPHGPLAEL